MSRSWFAVFCVVAVLAGCGSPSAPEDRSGRNDSTNATNNSTHPPAGGGGSGNGSVGGGSSQGGGNGTQAGTDGNASTGAGNGTTTPPERNDTLARASARLRDMGIDCAHENAHDTKRSLAIHPTNPSVMFVGVEGRGVFKTTDGGATWRSSSMGMLAYPDAANRSRKCFPDLSRIAFDPDDPRRVLVVPGDVSTGFPDWPYAETAGIWESLDEGATWRQVVNVSINVAGTGALAIDPRNSRVMYYGVNSDPPTFQEAPFRNRSINEVGVLYKTTDGGVTWEELPTGMLPGLQAMAIFVEPNDSDELLLLTQSHDHIYHETYVEEVFLAYQFGPMRSSDGGRTWTPLASNLPENYRAIFDGDVGPSGFDRFLVRTFVFPPAFPRDAEQRSYVTKDGGATFQRTPMYVHVGRYDPHDPSGDHVVGYAPWYAAGDLVESRDGGLTWTAISKPPEVNNVAVSVSNVVWHPTQTQTLFLTGTHGYVWKSTDGGASWTTILRLETLPT